MEHKLLEWSRIVNDRNAWRGVLLFNTEILCFDYRIIKEDYDQTKYIATSMTYNGTYDHEIGIYHSLKEAKQACEDQTSSIIKYTYEHYLNCPTTK